MSINEPKKLVFTVEEARKMLGLSRGLMYEAIRRGEIPNVKIGRRILIPRASLERMLGVSRTTIPESNTKVSADYEECGAKHRGTAHRVRKD